MLLRCRRADTLAAADAAVAGHMASHAAMLPPPYAASALLSVAERRE